jgi:hypothetical protein
VLNDVNTRLNGPRDLHKVGDNLYVASYADEAMQVINVATPTAPVAEALIRDTIKLNGASGVFASGSYAYMTSYL